MSYDPDRIAERLARVETEITWVKAKLDSIERRTWQILAVIIITWLSTIIVAVLK